MRKPRTRVLPGTCRARRRRGNDGLRPALITRGRTPRSSGRWRPRAKPARPGPPVKGASKRSDDLRREAGRSSRSPVPLQAGVGQRGTTLRYRCQVACPSTGMTTASPTKAGSEPSARSTATMRPHAAVTTGLIVTAQDRRRRTDVAVEQHRERDHRKAEGHVPHSSCGRGRCGALATSRSRLPQPVVTC